MTITTTPCGYPSPPMFQVTVHDATITRHGHIRCREGELYQGMNHNPKEEPGTQYTVEHPGGDFLGGETNIGHHIFEFMLRLPFIDGRRVIVWNDLPPVAIELLTLAGFSLEPVARSTRFKQVTAWSCPVGRFSDATPFVFGQNVERLRAMIPRRKSTTPGPEIYLVRRAKHRNILNDIELQRALMADGVECVWAESLSAQDQVDLMRDARLIVAPLGAGSPFTMFCDCPVVELSQPGINGEFGSKMWANVLLRPWARVVGDPVAPGRDADYWIDVDAVMDQVATARRHR
jgi:hypothetical protein